MKSLLILMLVIIITACSENNNNVITYEPLVDELLMDTIPSKVKVYNNNGYDLIAVIEFDGVRSKSFKERMHYNIFGSSVMHSYFAFDGGGLYYDYLNVDFYKKFGCPTKITYENKELIFIYDANDILTKISYLDKSTNIEKIIRKYNLDGNKVKDVESSDYWGDDKIKKEYFYNNEGLVNKINVYTNDIYRSYITFSYEHNLLFEEKYQYDSSAYNFTIKYSYNTKSCLLKKSYHNVKNQITSYSDYNYANNHLISYITTQMDEKQDYKEWIAKLPRLFEYDTNGLLIREPLQEPYGNLSTYIYKYK